MPRYSWRWDERIEVIRCCLECPRAKCTGSEECPRRAAVIEAIMAAEPVRPSRLPRGREIEIDGVRRNVTGWARAIGVTPQAIRKGAKRAGGEENYIRRKLCALERQPRCDSL